MHFIKSGHAHWVKLESCMLAQEVTAFLDVANHWVFCPFDGPLAVTPCENPL
ncbi:MAG: hypothetical protein NTV46_09445 [Verrucomicrobia bacterium]|nr:hypothetical protein [Verrucomicrobiota bacterium]